MFKVVTTISQLNCEQLFSVYANASEGNYGKFYDDLIDFFRARDARYYIWEEKGRYLSAMRSEQFLDGVIMAGVQTVANERRRGYASILLTEATRHIQATDSLPVYSHIDRKNRPSVRLHEACGFKKILDHAVFLDGSVSWNSDTYCLYP